MQNATVHVFAKSGACDSLMNPYMVAEAFNDFDVTETGTGMPCYCIQWNVSDSKNNAFFQAEVEEVRSSHDLSTATATHRIHYHLEQAGKVLLDRYVPLVAPNLNHFFGVKFEDAIAFYMDDFLDPNDFHRIITFFWYQFQQNGLRSGTPNVKQFISATSNCLIPYWFTPTDLSVKFVAIDGDVQFSESGTSKHLANIENGRNPNTVSGVLITAVQGDTSPCQTLLGTETSNACLTLQVVGDGSAKGQFSTMSEMTFDSTVVPPPPPPPPIHNLSLTEVQSVLMAASAETPPLLPAANIPAVMALMKAQAQTSV